MKIILEGKEADRYHLAIKLYDLHIALSRWEGLSHITLMREGTSYTDYVNSLTHCLREYLDECARLNAEYRKEQNND